MGKDVPVDPKRFNAVSNSSQAANVNSNNALRYTNSMEVEDDDTPVPTEVEIKAGCGELRTRIETFGNDLQELKKKVPPCAWYSVTHLCILAAWFARHANSMHGMQNRLPRHRAEPVLAQRYVHAVHTGKFSSRFLVIPL